MTEYIAPGVYVEEIERGPRPMKGAPTAIAAIVGATERGPLRPCLVASFADYLRSHGGFFGRAEHVPFAARGFFENGGRRLYVCRVASSNATTARADLGDYLLEAVGPGGWGNRIWVKLVGVRLRIACFAEGVVPYDCFDPANESNPAKPELVEEHVDIDMNLRLENVLPASVLVVLTRRDGAAGNLPASFNGSLAGGGDGDPLDAADFRGLPTAGRPAQGLAALEGDEVRDVALVAAPGADAVTLRALVEHCEAARFRFAVLDATRGATVEAGLSPRDEIADTRHGAFYWPWVEVEDPRTQARTFVPPSGHAMGVYARTDAERGVSRPPANEVLHGALGLEYVVDADTADLVVPRGVNTIRAFPGRGIRVWGARTLSSHAEWKYVSVCRLFMFLEHSIFEGLQWTVFEPNDETLWTRVRNVIDQFLLSQWRAGMFLGAKPEEAYFVRCDRTTMTQDDIDNGRLVCVVGFAALKPAEFTVIHIQQVIAGPSRV